MSVFPVTTSDEAIEVLGKIAREEYAVIYITEQFAKNMVSAIDQYRDDRFPAIIPIPGNQGSLGIGMMGLNKSV